MYSSTGIAFDMPTQSGTDTWIPSSIWEMWSQKTLFKTLFPSKKKNYLFLCCVQFYIENKCKKMCIGINNNLLV